MNIAIFDKYPARNECCIIAIYPDNRRHDTDNKDNNNKSLLIVTLCIGILAIGLSAAALIFSMANSAAKPAAEPTAPAVEVTSESEDIQFVLYLGTNDKDTNEPVFTREEAQEAAKEILIDNFGGYTIQEAEGGWKDGDKIYQEYTLVIYLSDTDINKVHTAADQLISKFHQSSILIQSNKTTTEFYSGS